ncbi:agmatine deiminase family protein [soil metagenome]
MQTDDLQNADLSALGYRMPAEWEPHEATWFAWPHKLETWPGKFEPIPAVYAQLVRALSASEEVRILVNDGEEEKAARKVLKEHRADASTVHFYHIPTNDVWVRDHGPIFVKSAVHKPGLIAIDWGYNSWGDKYPPYDLDDVVPHHVAKALKLPVVDGGMILEGGSIDVNGAGVLLTTEACLLNKNRNPHMEKDEIEERLKRFLGVRKVLWLGDGIEGDDTDGHVDDLTRFVNETTLVTVVESDKTDVNYGVLQDNIDRLSDMTDLNGRKFEIAKLPMPNPIEYDGTRLPASYANFYIGNSVVLLPTYDSGKKDDQAAEILKDFFPGRKIVSIRSTDLVWGLGSFHCISQQQPVR